MTTHCSAVVENYVSGITPDNQTNVRTSYTYDANGNRLSIRDGQSHLEGIDSRTTFTYDALGRLETEMDPLGHTTTYQYDAMGNRISLLDANGVTTIYGYDELNRLTLIDYPAPDADVTFDYDALGRRQSMNDGLGTTAWDYNNLDLPNTITDPFAASVAYDYDAVGNRTSLVYPNGQTVSYAYDAVGNRLTQASMVSGLSSVVDYVYDDANRLTSVNGVTYTWDNNGNLLNDGVNAYTYNTANQLKTLTSPSVNASYGYNGMGDRLQETHNGGTTNFMMDYNMGLTQVLNDGTNNYIYGNGRIAQVNTGTDYFLGDALRSVRQLTNSSGAITYASAYNPYGVVTQAYGASQTAYGYTGEYTSNDLVYLRSRYYAPGMGRFLTRDEWVGFPTFPISYNKWTYANANPINYVDPSGNFSESLIQSSLNGMSIYEAFGRKRYGVARWGLYALLKDMKSWDRLTLRIADFSYEGPYYPLAPDSEYPWMVYEHGCELVFLSPRTEYLSLRDFLNRLNEKAERNSNLSQGKWWRPATVEYHWYDVNGKFYSDFYDASSMPYLIMISGSPLLEFGNLTYIRDEFGNQYYAIAAGLPLGVGLGEAWEGYARLNGPPIWEGGMKQLTESELKSIILGWSINTNLSIVSTGAGLTFWRTGMISLFGESNPSLGLSIFLGYTWEASIKDYVHSWNWLNEIPRYGPP